MHLVRAELGGGGIHKIAELEAQNFFRDSIFKTKIKIKRD